MLKLPVPSIRPPPCFHPVQRLCVNHCLLVESAGGAEHDMFCGSPQRDQLQPPVARLDKPLQQVVLPHLCGILRACFAKGLVFATVYQRLPAEGISSLAVAPAMNAEALLNKKEPSLENLDPATVSTSLNKVQAGKELQIRWDFSLLVLQTHCFAAVRRQEFKRVQSCLTGKSKKSPRQPDQVSSAAWCSQGT